MIRSVRTVANDRLDTYFLAPVIAGPFGPFSPHGAFFPNADTYPCRGRTDFKRTHDVQLSTRPFRVEKRFTRDGASAGITITRRRRRNRLDEIVRPSPRRRSRFSRRKLYNYRRPRFAEPVVVVGQCGIDPSRRRHIIKYTFYINAQPRFSLRVINLYARRAIRVYAVVLIFASRAEIACTRVYFRHVKTIYFISGDCS